MTNRQFWDDAGGELSSARQALEGSEAPGTNESIAHTLQGLTELNPRATVVSMDGINAFDEISRAAMHSGLPDVGERWPGFAFVRVFHGSFFVLMGKFVWCCSHDSPGGKRRTRGCFDASLVLIGPTQGPGGDPVGVARGEGKGSCSRV